MDLPTHFAFGIAVGLVFFGSPFAALLIGLGTLLPDLDREYWYVRPKKFVDEAKEYADEQVHRARFHNVFMLPFAYLISPFLGLGVFLHMLQDSFTTAKDRGVEWFYPLTRLVRRGLNDPQGNPMPRDPKEQVYFPQEDPKGLINNADPDLREVGPDPVPWRRVYGFAQNKHILDRGFLFGSASVLLVWILRPLNPSNFVSLVMALESKWLWLGFLAVGMLYAAGETDRRDLPARLPQLKPLAWPLLYGGAALLALWGTLFGVEILHNVEFIFSDPVLVISTAGVVGLAVLLTVLWQLRNDRKNNRPTIV
ncbi:MAG TPA: metal-dependent hydrolase [Nitrososphaerales archaeon]|nr:metal-dependent hydrolase [Nitrososphaerales archaeon]